MTGAGGVVFAGGSHTLAAGTVFDAAALTLSNTSVAFGAGVAPGLTTLDINASSASFADSRTLINLTLRGDGRLGTAAGQALTVSGTFGFQAGTLLQNSRIIIAPGGVGNLTTSSGKFIDGVLENRGTLNYTGTAFFFGRDNPNFFARIENTAGGTFIVDGEGGFSQNHASPNYRIENAGNFIKSGAGTTTVVSAPVQFGNTGTVQLTGGALSPLGGFTQNGTVRGSGTLIGNVSNNGMFKPDPVPGGITVQGSYTQTVSGRLELTLHGADATLQHRSLRITGAAAFNGALDVALQSPFAEPQNATFPVMSFSGRSGDFTSVTGLTDNFGYTFSRAYTGTALALTIATVGALPTPPAGARILTGYAHWIGEQAVLAGNDARLGRTEDPDGDGSTNLQEYAFGTPPFNAGPVVQPVPSTLQDSGLLWAVLEFPRRIDTPSLQYEILESTVPGGWSPVSDTLELGSIPVPGQPGLEIVRLAVWPALTKGESRFLRVRIEELQQDLLRLVPKH